MVERRVELSSQGVSKDFLESEKIEAVPGRLSSIAAHIR